MKIHEFGEKKCWVIHLDLLEPNFEEVNTLAARPWR